MRKEHDFLGELEVPDEAYYGVQTLRAKENFQITGQTIDRDLVQAMAAVKKAAALANMETGRLTPRIGEALVRAADEILAGKLLDQFPLDPIQGGAGTSVNMNMNEVLSNRALELLGEPLRVPLERFELLERRGVGAPGGGELTDGRDALGHGRRPRLGGPLCRVDDSLLR